MIEPQQQQQRKTKHAKTKTSKKESKKSKKHEEKKKKKAVVIKEREGPPSVIDVVHEDAPPTTNLEEPKTKRPSRLDTFIDSGGDINLLSRYGESSDEEIEELIIKEDQNDEDGNHHHHHKQEQELQQQQQQKHEDEERDAEIVQSLRQRDNEEQHFGDSLSPHKLISKHNNDEGTEKTVPMSMSSTSFNSRSYNNRYGGPPSPNSSSIHKHSKMRTARKDWMRYLAEDDGSERTGQLKKELDFIQDVISEQQRQKHYHSSLQPSLKNHSPLRRKSHPDDDKRQEIVDSVKGSWNSYLKSGDKAQALQQELDSIQCLLQQHRQRSNNNNPSKTSKGARKRSKSRIRKSP